MTDALTGICNRHGFDEQVEQYMRQNPQKHCVVAMLDIDDFKLVNDMYGHAAGDGALQKLAESMKQYFSRMLYSAETEAMSLAFSCRIAR